MKVAAAVILYNPSVGYIDNIKSYYNAVEKLYVFDNSQKSRPVDDFLVSLIDKCIYFQDGQNEGIALRLNQACNKAIEEGFEWLLTMDQDSSFSEAGLNSYLKCISQFQGIHEVAMFGINYTNNTINEDVCIANETVNLITSGSVLNLKLFNEIGGFDENLFIDEVDFEYCLKAKLGGYKTIQFSNIFLNHQLGQTSYHTSFKNLQTTPRSLHSPVRLYYMTRNYLYLKKKYRHCFKREMYERRKALINRIKNNLLYNKEQFAVIKNIISANSDYHNMKMGKKM